MEGILQRSFKVNILILRIIGLYPAESHSKMHKLRGFVMYFLVLFPTAVLCFLRFIFEGNISGIDRSDIESFGFIFLGIKFFSFLLNSDELQRCMKRFDATFFTKAQDEYDETVNNCVKICLRNSWVFIVGVSLSVSAWLVSLYFQDYRSQLPLNVWFPFKFEDNPALYRYVYVTFIICAVYTGLACAAVDSLIPGLLCHASGQIRSLKTNLQRLDHNIEGKSTNSVHDLYNKIIYNKITECVIYYTDVLMFVSEYEKCCSAVVFTQFLESIFVIGLSCLQIIKSQAFNFNLLYMITYLFTFLFQVYFYCYYGTVLLAENNSVPTAIYTSNWYEFSAESQKSLFILMERSKRPLVVTAGKVLDLSLDTFTMILNRSYSLIALFQNY